jgi:hypothetical protein
VFVFLPGVNRLHLKINKQLRIFAEHNILQIGGRKTGLWEDFFLLPAGLLAAAFYGVEQNYLKFSRAFIMGADETIEKLPGFLKGLAAMLLTDGMTLVGRTIVVLFLLVLLPVAFSNGIRRRLQFILLSAVMLLLPRIWLAVVPQPDYDRKILSLLTNLADLFAHKPFLHAAAWLERSHETLGTLLLLSLLFAFSMGWLFGARFYPRMGIIAKNKQKICS